MLVQVITCLDKTPNWAKIFTTEYRELQLKSRELTQNIKDKISLDKKSWNNA